MFGSTTYLVELTHFCSLMAISTIYHPVKTEIYFLFLWISASTGWTFYINLHFSITIIMHLLMIF